MAKSPSIFIRFRHTSTFSTSTKNVDVETELMCQIRMEIDQVMAIWSRPARGSAVFPPKTVQNRRSWSPIPLTFFFLKVLEKTRHPCLFVWLGDARFRLHEATKLVWNGKFSFSSHFRELVVLKCVGRSLWASNLSIVKLCLVYENRCLRFFLRLQVC